MIEKIKRPLSLVEATLEGIRSGIINGEFALGQQITESYLSKTFGLSKTPVREALSLLKSEGLVVSETHKGFKVFKMDEKELSDFCELRLALESQALSSAFTKNRLNLVRKLKKIVKEMEKCIKSVDIKNLVNDIIKKYTDKTIHFVQEENLLINLRANAIKRCLTNLIDNGLAYGKKVEIITEKTNSDIIICVDDNGPGIPESEYKNVMKPFYRIDKSRGQNKSGVGLGLSIANDIIRSHGGNISLDKSPLNGLRVKISLPF